jgi:hypothetical protein
MSQISDPGGSATIETVRGHLDERVSEELLAFWARHGFAGQEARERLEQVVCVLRDRGEIAGASSVFKADVELIGRRRFWVFRSLLPGTAAEHALAMIRATFRRTGTPHRSEAGRTRERHREGFAAPGALDAACPGLPGGLVCRTGRRDA